MEHEVRNEALRRGTALLLRGVGSLGFARDDRQASLGMTEWFRFVGSLGFARDDRQAVPEMTSVGKRENREFAPG